MLKHVTSDGRTFENLDDALKHESNLGVAEKEREKRVADYKKELNERIAAKKADYDNVISAINAAKSVVYEYNKKYGASLLLTTKVLFDSKIDDSDLRKKYHIDSEKTEFKIKPSFSSDDINKTLSDFVDMFGGF